eukprot:Gb_02880 [translate_table: standard]
MVHTLKASAPFVFLDRRCILGQGVRIAPAGQMAMRLNSYTPRRSGISCRAYAVASNGTVCTSWFPTDPTQCDAYGGWSHGGITLEKEKRKVAGIAPLVLVGAGTSLAIIIALWAHLAFLDKGFRARLYAPAAGLHQLLMPVTSRVLPPFKMADHVHATAEDIDPILPDVGKTVPSNLRDENQKEKDYDSEKIEVSCVPGTEIRPGRTIIPAAFDPAQVEALSVLEKLKIVQSHIEPGGLCSRREYARWFVSANSVLARNPGNRVFPSVYVEGFSVLAFDDITPRDPDFPYIQGLAEAGVIPSKLSINNQDMNMINQKESRNGTMFYPESPLSRLDLLSWKVIVEHKHLPEIDKKTLEKKSGFVDIDRISKDAWPTVYMDVLAGDQSITAKAFGYSRRFQPDKPVTKGQAAVAIISGQVEDMVREELSRLEAENSAKEEVVQEILSEMFSRGEIKSMWEKKVSQKKAQRVEAEKLLESVVYELENEKAEREKMLPLFLKEKTMLEVEHKLLVSLKLEVDELKQALSVGEMEVLLEQQQLEKHRMDYQVRNEALSKAKSLAEAEKKALTLSRLWVEDEARRTQAQGEILAEAVKRWKFSEASLACSCWCHHQEKTKEIASSEEHKSGHVSSHQFWHLTKHITLNALQQKTVKTLRELEDGAQKLQIIVFSAAGEKANEMQRLFSAIPALLSANICKIFQKLDAETAGNRTQ